MKMIRGQIFLTTGEVAFNFGVTARTILRWSSSENNDGPQLNPVKGPNKRLYFRKEEIDQLLDHYFGSAVQSSRVEHLPQVQPPPRRAANRHGSSRMAAIR
jgi:DNA-binding transcriptional MerR regulator